MTDSLVDGRRFRLLNIMDDYNRESLAVEVDTSLPAARVIRALDELVEVRGTPLSIRMDNGPEFIANALAATNDPTAPEVVRALEQMKKNHPGRMTVTADDDTFQIRCDGKTAELHGPLKAKWDAPLRVELYDEMEALAYPGN